ncbi:MAG: gfo/Idh/MocA family oxidoreductase [Acidobacteria bacterium]|nr:MAG: gfo/Idh/MocA family oxidoreductase [Acidobacteriota bacterium]RPJ73427.1 MAG: gfo/Idh/MocA family oxidoreductase [Acidobacteriota bacterium]
MTLHIGLVGGGGITESHARAARDVPGLEIAAVQGSNREKVEAICARHGGRPYADFEAFLAHRPLDLVAIGSPSGLHALQGIAAAKAGLHVLVEKPIDITTAGADALVAEARAAGVAVGVFFQDRLKPDVCRMKGAIDSGAIGRPILADARVPWYRPPEYYGASRWRGTWALDGGGALMNQGIHTVDLLVWLLGDVARVHARTATLLHEIEVEDSGAAILEFASGALGVLSFTTAAYPGYPRRVSVTGDAGSIVLEQDAVVAWDLREPGSFPPALDGSADSRQHAAGSRQQITRDPLQAASRPLPAVPVITAASSPVVTDVAPHRAVIEDFLQAIREGRPPRCDGRDGRRSVAIVEAIYRSSRSGHAERVG